MGPNFTGFPERIHAFIHDAKFIYIARYLIKRITPHYINISGTKSGDMMRLPLSSLTQMSRALNTYSHQRSHYLQSPQYIEFYDISRVPTLTLEEMLRVRGDTLPKAFRIQGVDVTFSIPEKIDFTDATNPRTLFYTTGIIALLIEHYGRDRSIAQECPRE